MSDTKFTPGPWRIVPPRINEPNGVNGAKVRGPSGRPVCNVPRRADRPVDQKRADLALIAAAPEMYEALSAINALFAEPLNCLIRKVHGSITNGDQDVIDAAFSKMMHALAKAEATQ